MYHDIITLIRAAQLLSQRITKSGEYDAGRLRAMRHRLIQHTMALLDWPATDSAHGGQGRNGVPEKIRGKSDGLGKKPLYKSPNCGIMDMGASGKRKVREPPRADTSDQAAFTADARAQREKGNWVTINGAHVLLNEEGTIVGGPENLKGISYAEVKQQGRQKGKGKAQQQTSRQKKYEGTAGNPSAKGTNEPCKGFASEEKLYDHASRHGPEFGTKDYEEYQREGIEFLVSAVGGNIQGYVTPEGKIVRFNPETGQYASGFPGKVFCTYMRPKIRKKDLYYDKQKAIAYYNSVKEKELAKVKKL